MKKFIFSFILMAFIVATGFQLVAQQKISMQPGQSTLTETMVNPSRDAWNVLVIRDYLPWGYDATVPVLNGLGATVSTATSATFPALDFSLFDKIIVESVQDNNFYNIFQANLSKFEVYVINGGVLQINACTYAENLNLPGGVSAVSQYSNDGYHAKPGHPILSGVPDPFYGSWASHIIITNLPATAEILTRDIPGNEPTTVIYGLGSGFVLATGLTIEIAYYFEDNGQGYFNFGLAMYPNMLDYRSWRPIPLSNWALIIGVVLIGTFILIRFRRLA